MGGVTKCNHNFRYLAVIEGPEKRVGSSAVEPKNSSILPGVPQEQIM